MEESPFPAPEDLNEDSGDDVAESLIKLNLFASCLALGISSLTFLVFKDAQKTWGFVEYFGSVGFILDFILGILALASVLSIPVTAIIGIGGMAASIKYGVHILLYGIIAFIISALNFFLWVKYGGLPL